MNMNPYEQSAGNIKNKVETNKSSNTAKSNQKMWERVRVFLVSAVFGVLLILNQFGEAINVFVDISLLSFLWSVNSHISSVSFGALSAFIIFILSFHSIVIENDEMRSAFWYAVVTGAIAVPTLGLGGAIIGAAVWLVYWVVKVVILILETVFIPFYWVFSNIISPTVSFIAYPLLWLQEAAMPIIGVVSAPFVWISHNVFYPILNLVLNFLIKPVFLFLVVVISGGLVLLVPVTFGRVYIHDLKTAIKKQHSPRSIFSHGVSFGLIIFTVISTYILTIMDMMTNSPSASLILLTLIPLVFLIRYSTADISIEGGKEVSYTNRIRYYVSNSGLNFLFQCCVIPAGIVLWIYANLEE